jgi:hypothetical protein
LQEIIWRGKSNGIVYLIFTDEKRFCLDGPDGYLYYFHDLRKEEEFAARHHRRESGVMVWGAISSKGVVHFSYLCTKGVTTMITPGER